MKIKRYISWGLILVGILLSIIVQIINDYELYEWQSTITKITQGYLILVLIYVLLNFLIVTHNYFKSK